MSLVLMRYQGRDWHGLIRIEQEMPEFFAICLTCDSDTNLTVDVSVHVTRTTSRLLLSLFSPYWIINKTSRVLQYRAEEVGVKHAADYRDIVLFSFKKKNLFSKNKVRLAPGLVENGIVKPSGVFNKPMTLSVCCWISQLVVSTRRFGSFCCSSVFLQCRWRNKLNKANYDLILKASFIFILFYRSSCVSQPAPGLMVSLWTLWEVMAVFAVPPTTWTSW